MGYRLLADGIVAIHFMFVIFAVAGGLIVYYRPKLAWIHLPCVFWGELVEFAGWICPLTPLENYLRHKSLASVYNDGFIMHYMLSILYPQMLTRQIQILLGFLVLGINLLLYGYIVKRFLKMKKVSTEKFEKPQTGRTP